MENSNIGELIIDHYEKYLGLFEDCLEEHNIDIMNINR